MDNKRTIAIVCGGDSSEHEVSLRSAHGLYSFFDHDRYNIYIVVIKGLDWHVNLPNGDKAPIDRNDFSFIAYGVKTRFDYAYITIHGTPGENGIMQGYFDLLRIPYSTCNVLVESLTFDKFALIRYIRAFGVNTAKSILVRNDDKERPTPAEIESVVGMPCFVKPVANGSSFGVSKVKSADQLEQAIQKAFGEGDDVMIEEFLDGTEVTVGCYRTKEKTVVFPVTEVVTDNEFFDYDAKYNGQVQEITPARISDKLTAELQELTARIYGIMHCNGIIRIDYIITHNEDGSRRINLLEINTTPGMTATSFIPQQVRAAGLDIKDVLTEIVENQF